MSSFVLAKMRPSPRGGTSFPAIRPYPQSRIEILTRPTAEAVEAQWRGCPCQDLSKFAADRPDWNLMRGSPVKGSERPERVKDMKRTVLALTTAVTIGVTALTSTSPAEARWRGGGWGPGLAAGLVGAAVIGGIASSAYAYGPGYGYYGGYPAYGYYGGYAPAYYGYAPAYYYGGYGPRSYGGFGGYGYHAPADDYPYYRW
jgi:hypothetical protein